MSFSARSKRSAVIWHTYYLSVEDFKYHYSYTCLLRHWESPHLFWIGLNAIGEEKCLRALESASNAVDIKH